jgi:hypothetical protein
MSLVIIRNEDNSDIDAEFEEKGYYTQFLDKPTSTKGSVYEKPRILGGMFAAFLSLI